MTQRNVLQSLTGIMLGMFVALLAATIVSSSMPRIVTELGGSQASYTWVITATLLAQTISTPLWGKFSDQFGRKPLVMIALAITVASAAAAGFAHSIGWLIAARGVQGLGAGGLMALSSVLVADIVSPRERGKYMGLFGAVQAVAQVGGPLVGGLITDSALGWRWNFFVGIPFAILAAVVLQRTLHLPQATADRERPRIDWWGIALITGGVGLLLVWITFAGAQFPWVSTPSIIMGGSALALIAAAVVVELRTDEPMIPLRLFADRTFTLAVIASIAVGVAMFGSSVFLAQYLQLSRAKTPTQSSLLIIPMVAGMLASGIVLGRLISRTGRYKAVLVGGAIAFTVALAGLSRLTETTSLWYFGAFLFLLGVSVGALMQNLVLAVQNTLEHSVMGAGTAAVAFFRTLGGSIGVSALGAVLARYVLADITSGLSTAGVPANVLGTGDALPALATLPKPVVDIVEHAYADGIAHIFAFAIPLALIALVAVIFLKEIPLGDRSGVQRMLDDEGELGAPESLHAVEAAANH
jgi:EmrB/QacA subfamily drug resistance transporter